MPHYYYRFLRNWLMACWLLGGSLPALATHIVGGEFELQTLGTPGALATHRLTLNLYFDDINGDRGAEDNVIRVYFYQKRNNQYMGAADLYRLSSAFVPYTTPACAISSLRTRLIRYSSDLTLTTAFSDPGGYYIVWERCCRNGTISNIVAPGDAGSAFYLEFPPVYNGRNLLVNSTPVFTPIQGDYSCVGRPFTFDFGARDPDGDSLVYTLVTPYNGYSSKDQGNIVPPARSGPYPPVRWNTGLSATNAIPGPAPLRVNARTGQLTVTAAQVGLYVFSVEVLEYRRGQLLGRVRRDFQLKVIDCPANNPPQVLMRPAGSRTFYQEGTVLTISEQQASCLDLFVTDRDPNQRITLTTPGEAAGAVTFTPNTLVTRTGRDTLRSQVCLGRCLGRADGQPVTLALIATDEGCPQGQQDTLLVRVRITPEPNAPPVVRTDLTPQAGRVTVGSSLTFTAFGTDPDRDSISIRAVGRGFDLAQAGMSFVPAQGAGQVAQPFRWRPVCAQVRQADYLVDFIVTDNRCNNNKRDTVTVSLSAVGPPSRPPTVQTTLPPAQLVELTVSPGGPAGDTTATQTAFDVLGDDPDRDTIRLTALGRGFDTRALGMSFTNRSGLPTLRSPFAWTPTCELLEGRDEAVFVVDFVADDRSCQPTRTDTTTVTFRVKNLPANYDLTIPNVFTPNGDGINDFFTIPDLPADNCTDQFRDIEIVNRWGARVFRSADRQFRWSGDKFPAGQYFYTVRYVNRAYKGIVTLMRP